MYWDALTAAGVFVSIALAMLLVFLSSHSH
jgi:hypothetical protein